MTGFRRLVRVALACGLIFGGVLVEARAADGFEKCATAVAARPGVYESYRCYYEVASSSGDWRTAGQKLAALAAARPEIDWIVFVRAAVTWPLDKARAEELYAQAAKRFATAGNVRGEVLARANLQTIYYESGRLGQAAREVERVGSLGERAQEEEIRIRARIVESQFYINTGTNLGRAERALRQAEAELGDEHAYWMRQLVLHELGNVLLLTGQYDEAVRYFQRLQREAGAQRDLGTIARARISAVNALLEWRAEDPLAVDASTLHMDAKEALTAAGRAQDLDLELEALRLNGEVLMDERPEPAAGYLESCIERARAHERTLLLSECLWLRARLLASIKPAAARLAIDSAIRLLETDEGVDHGLLAHAWRHAMRMAWQTQSADAALVTGRRALAAIEHLRDLQPGLDDRAASFSTWTRDYYWLSGRLLRLADQVDRSGVPDAGSRAHAFLDEAFQITERMRARSLLDRLKAPPLAPTDLDDETQRRREALLTSIVEINRKLLKSTGDDVELLRALESLERQELDARAVIAHPRVMAPPVGIAEVQRKLAGHEALLSFQIGLTEAGDGPAAGGSWMIAITREQVRYVALPDRHLLGQSLALFRGMTGQSALHATRAGHSLYRQLFQDTLESLQPGIHRLIIVPDWPLDTFPFAALSRRPESWPLAKDFEIVLVPSATIWRTWRDGSVSNAPRQALVLADPRLEFAQGGKFSWRATFRGAELPLESLPKARTEGLGIARRLRDQSTVWIGNEASEAALKATELSQFGLLHFATHTVIDGTRTDRSAILLAAGSTLQDGLLQSREIADLGLADAIVVLSSCQSATGTPVRGEGVLGIARSFFNAGARTVIASLWPIRDDHAEAFFSPFYAELAQGHSVGAAFHESQRRLIHDGMPAEAWSGFVLIGDADLKPLRRSPAVWPGIWMIGIAAVLAAVVLGMWVPRIARSRPATRGPLS